MKKFIAKVRALPIKARGLIAIVAAAILVPAGLYAWGPSRDTYTWEKPADHVVFNSMTNNPKWGDERNFVKIRNYTDNGSFSDNVDLQVGKEYEVQVYFHNNASTTFNDAAHNYSGVAKGAYARVMMPATVPVNQSARIDGFVGASNAKPGYVWDEAYGKNSSSAAIDLRYIQNSAVINSLGSVNGQKIDLNKLASNDGALIGYSKLDGSLPGCNQYAGYITYRFKVDQPNFTIEKTVSKADAKDYKEQVTVKANETVDFKIKYKNTGTETQNNVIIKDVLPNGLVYVPGSTMISNSNTGNKWVDMTSGGTKTDAIVATNGANIGTHNTGGASYLKFKAKVDSSKLKCGVNTLTNTAYAVTENGTKQDTASVVVEKECQEEVKPVYKCDLLTIDKISTNEYKFSVKYTASNGATYKGTTYKVYDASGKEAYNSAEGKFSGFAAGTYTVKAFVTISVNGKDETVTSEACAQKVTIPEQPTPTPEKEKVCELETKKIITINKDEFDSSKHSRELDDCKETPAEKTIEVCNLETKTFITIKESEFDKTKHSNNPDDCKPAPTTPDNDITVCKREDKTIVTIKKSAFDTEKYTETLSECDETPETPAPTTTVTELPATGIGGAILSLSGVGSLGYAIYAYIASRRIQ